MNVHKYNVTYAVRACFRYAPWASIVKLSIELINGALAPLMILVTAFFIDGALALAAAAVAWTGTGLTQPGAGVSHTIGGPALVGDTLSQAGGAGRIAPLIAAVAALAGYYAWTQLSQIIVRLADKSLENALREKLRAQLTLKQTRVEYALIETAETSDLITLVCANAEARFASILNTAIMVVRLVIQAAGTLTLLAAHVWWTLPMFLAGAIPIFVIARKGGKAIYKSDAVTTVLTRRHYYLSGVLSGKEAAAERTLFGYSDWLNKKYSAAHLKRSNMVTKEIAMEEASISACELVLNVFLIIAVFALLGPAKNGAVSHGLYVSLIGALIGFTRMLTSSVSRLISDATGHAAYMRDYARFWSLPETKTELKHTENDSARETPSYNDSAHDAPSYNETARDTPSRNGAACDNMARAKKPAFTGLSIRNLRFRYTPDGAYVLNGVNLDMAPGRSYALIGKNGAGKSTLTKILLGLYRNFEGEIFINGASIAEYETDELRAIFSVVYQDFAKYYIPLADNIVFGASDGDLDSALRLAELDEVVARLPRKAETPLGKIYDGGADISGGEWQRLAIARALYADAPFMILDEPAASLSPMMESKLYGRFAEITKDRTSLLISHRLGSTKLSDVLFVLENGVIAETGTHAELMDLGGAYAEMFRSQRSWYLHEIE